MTLSVATVGASIRPLWLPSSLGGNLIYWLDADEASTLTTSSGAVSQWNDRSSSVRHMKQTDATRRPSTSTFSGTSRGSVLFDGTSDYLTGGTSGLTIPLCVLAAIDYASFTSSPYLICTGNNRMVVQALSTGPWRMFNAVSMDRGARTTDPVVLACLFNSTSSELWVNGTKQGATGNTGTGNPSLATLLYLGAAYNNTSYSNADVGEVLVVSGAIATADREKAEGYLAWKWGMQANLPSAHPYKTSAP